MVKALLNITIFVPSADGDIVKDIITQHFYEILEADSRVESINMYELVTNVEEGNRVFALMIGFTRLSELESNQGFYIETVTKAIEIIDNKEKILFLPTIMKKCVNG